MHEWGQDVGRGENPVPEVEALLDLSAERVPDLAESLARPAATRALLICACVTLFEAPTWVIYEDARGSVFWSEISTGVELSDVVDAARGEWGHADPSAGLAWLRGEAGDPWRGGDGAGDPTVAADLLRRIRRT